MRIDTGGERETRDASLFSPVNLVNMLTETRFVAAPERMAMENPFWLERIRCPKTKLGGLTTSAISEPSAAGVPQNGYLVCKAGGTVYDIKNGILDLTTKLPRNALTSAGWSNHFPPTPQLYERLWRQRALTLLTGEKFPVAREIEWLNAWAQLEAGECVVDLGTSTGLYARGLSERGATIFAVDLAGGMLREAQGYIQREQRRGIVLMRAAAENLPFHDASMDAVVVGGSLNEMKSIASALHESHRVVRRGGRMVVMSLVKAYKQPGMVLQSLARQGGIQFPQVNELNAMAMQARWKIAKQELEGIVLFTLLVK